MSIANIKLHEWIKKTIDETSGLTQKGLAKATGMNPATVNRMLYGRRHIRAEEVPLIERYLGRKYNDNLDNNAIDLESEYTQSSNSHSRAFSDSAVMQQGFGYSHQTESVIPVYQSSVEGEKNDILLNKEHIVDWVDRHPSQKGVMDAFAVYIPTNMFEPRYYMGEMVYIHAGRPPLIYQDSLVFKKDGYSFLSRYLGSDGDSIILSCLNNGNEFKLGRADIKSLCAVVGRS